MPKIALIFILTIFSATAGAEHSLSKALFLIKTGQQTEGVKQLEDIYQKTKLVDVQVSAAYVLSTAPENQLKIPPFVYADFVLKNDKNLNLNQRSQLIKIAGDGLYKNGKFKSAMKWYKIGVEERGLKINQKEYFNYKLAWCHINLKASQKGFYLLNNWIKSNSSDLRKAIIYDLGRSYAESEIIENKAVNIKQLTELNQLELSEFADGFIRGALRADASFAKVLPVVKKTSFGPFLLSALVANKKYSELNPCVSIKYYQPGDEKLWEKNPQQILVKNCLINLLKTDQPSIEPFLILSKIFKPHKIEEKWLAAKLSLKIDDKAKACNFLSDSFTSESYFSIWLDDFADACTSTNKLKALSRSFEQLNLDQVKVVFSNPKFSSEIKSYFYKHTNKLNSSEKKEVLNIYLSSIEPNQRITAIKEVCTTPKKCSHLWGEWVPAKHWDEDVSKVLVNKKEHRLSMINENLTLVFKNFPLYKDKMSIDEKDLLLLNLFGSKENEKAKKSQWETSLRSYVKSLLTDSPEKIPEWIVGTKFAKEIDQLTSYGSRLQKIGILNTTPDNLKQNLLTLRQTFDQAKTKNWKTGLLIKELVSLFNQKVTEMLVTIDTLKHRHLGHHDWFLVSKEVEKWLE